MKRRKGIGAMDRRPLFQNVTYSVDAGGGTSEVVTEQWNAWAEIQDRSGSSFIDQSQELVRYDYRVKVRFDGRFNSQTVMIYEGQVCKPESMVIETEGYKDYLVFRYTRTETWVDLS